MRSKFLLFGSLFLLVAPMLLAQTPAPWVLVLPADNQTGNASLDPIGTTVANTISRTLRLLGDFEVREIPAEEIPPDVVAGDRSALREFATEETMDYIVFGSVQAAADGFEIDAAVWDRSADEVSVRESRQADSLFDTFNVSDELAAVFLSVFSGQRIAFGEIRITREGWPEGEYRVLIDNAEVARNASVVTNVLIGEREVIVEALTGPQAGEVLLDESVTVREDEVSALSFTMEQPAVPEAEDPPEEPAEESEAMEDAEEAAQEPTETREPDRQQAEAVAVEDEPGEREMDDEGPWRRRTRSVAGQRPIYSTGLAYRPTVMRPFGGDPTFLVRGVFEGPVPAAVWFSVDFPGGLYLGGRLGAALALEVGDASGDDPPQTADVETVVAAGDIDSIPTGRIDAQLDLGRQIYQQPVGAWDLDVVALGSLGGVWQLFELVSTVDEGSVNENELLGDENVTIDNNTWYLINVGAGAETRMHFRRLAIRARLELVYEFAISRPEGPLEVQNSTVQGPAPDAFGDGLAAAFTFGVGYSWGGRERRR